MQLISGMSKAAYWMSNMIADIIKLYVPIIMIVLISYVFGADYPGVWVLYMLMPWALVPFTYVTSFLFEKDSTAQILTLLVNYVVVDLFAFIVYVLQFIPQTFGVGDALRWILCIFPTYCLSNGILWSADGEIVLLIRQQYPDAKQLSSNLWAFGNLGGDAFFLCLHFVVDSAILIAIEYELFSCLKNWSLAKVPPPVQNL